MALKDIKTKIGATKRTNKVTRAMEAVSAAKMRRTQQTALSGRAYARAALAILGRLSGSGDVIRHGLTTVRPVSHTALLIITSDKGLAGGLNSGVIRSAAEAISSRPVDSLSIYAYGRKGQEYFTRRGYDIAASYENKKDTIDTVVMEDIARMLSDAFVKNDYDEVLVAYSNYKSTFEQVPTVRRLLPLDLSVITQMVDDIVPTKGMYSELKQQVVVPAYSFEPDGREVLDELLPRLVAVSLYHMFLESKASEHSARMVAMKNATDKSKEVVQLLTRRFNKMRQAGITREVSEIVSGREALAA